MGERTKGLDCIIRKMKHHPDGIRFCQLYEQPAFCTQPFLFFGMKICEGSLSVVEVNVLPSDTVEETRSRIAKAMNCPADCVRLIFMGRLLQNGYPLSYYGRDRCHCFISRCERGFNSARREESYQQYQI